MLHRELRQGEKGDNGVLKERAGFVRRERVDLFVEEEHLVDKRNFTAEGRDVAFKFQELCRIFGATHKLAKTQFSILELARQ